MIKTIWRIISYIISIIFSLFLMYLNLYITDWRWWIILLLFFIYGLSIAMSTIEEKKD